MEAFANILQRWRAWRQESTNRAIFGAALTIAFTTLLVNAATVLKDIDVARIFGVSDALDVFLMANLIPTFCISVLAGSLFTSFVPVYIGVRETGSAALFLLLGTVAVIVWLRALKRRQARRTGPTYLRFFGQSEWDTRSRVYGPPIEQKHHPNLES